MSKRTRRVALYIANDNKFDHRIALGVINYAKLHGEWELFGYGNMFLPLHNIKKWNGDGIIARIKTKKDACNLRKVKLPVIDVAGNWAISHSVWHTDHGGYKTGIIGAEHLLECGYANFAFCHAEGCAWSAERLVGFRTKLAENNKTATAFSLSMEKWEKPGNKKDLQSWLFSLPRPCGIMACNDLVGYRVINSARSIDVTIPDDFGIIGVDNEELVCELAKPALTSIPLDCEGIGYAAAALLDSILEEKIIMVKPNDNIPQSPIIRHSTIPNMLLSKRLKSALDFIKNNSGSRGLTIQSVAEHVAVSKRTLQIDFKKYLSRSVQNEIIASRLNLAKKLLLNKDFPVFQIAVAAGFISTQHFCNLFKRHFSLSPLKWRVAYLNKKSYL